MFIKQPTQEEIIKDEIRKKVTNWLDYYNPENTNHVESIVNDWYNSLKDTKESYELYLAEKEAQYITTFVYVLYNTRKDAYLATRGLVDSFNKCKIYATEGRAKAALKLRCETRNSLNEWIIQKCELRTT